MTRYRFFLQLLALNLALLATLLALSSRYPALEDYQGLYLSSLATLSTICILLFEVGKLTIKAQNPNAFSQFFLASIGLKMLITLLVLMVYIQQYPPAPTQKWFILPFFLIYLAFMGFEVGFLSKIAKIDSDDDEADVPKLPF